MARNYEGRIHLLLTDLKMPYLEGGELAQSVARCRPETRVLVISARADEAGLQQLLALPGAAFMPKPFTLAALSRKVREVLDAPSGQARESARSASGE